MKDINEAIKQLNDDIDTVKYVYKDTMLSKSPDAPFGTNKEYFVKCYETAIEALEKQISTTMFMEKLEAWEAKLIETDECWVNGLPKLTQELYDEWMELQKERNELLGRFK